MSFDPATMRARFHELGKQRDDIATRAKPIRDRYDVLVQQQEALRLQIRPLLDQIKAIEKPLFDIEQERAALTRALAGRTGEAG